MCIRDSLGGDGLEEIGRVLLDLTLLLDDLRLDGLVDLLARGISALGAAVGSPSEHIVFLWRGHD